MPPTGVGIDLALPEKEWEEFLFYHVCLHGILSLAWLMRSRGVSRGWRERIHKTLPLLRGVSFHVGVKGEDVLRALGLVAGGSLQLVGMAICRELSACDIEEILKFLDATCVCFITAGPITKLFAWGGRRVDDMCYERRRAEACVDESAHHALVNAGGREIV